MKTKCLLAAIAIQVLILAYMAFEREWIVQTGKVIYLRTMPVDPRDFMRGDYVRLNYELSQVSSRYWKDGLLAARTNSAAIQRDTAVYASLRMGEDGVAEVTALSDKRPSEGLYIKARVDHATDREIGLRYGIEAYFMQQGKALELERRQSQGNSRIPMEMEVALSPRGTAVLRGQRWCPLGIGLSLNSTPDNSDNRPAARMRLISAQVWLSNTSSNDIAIVDLTRQRSFALASRSIWGQNNWSWVRADQDIPSPVASEVILLKPGQSHTNRIQFSDPDWFVVNEMESDPKKRTPVSLTSLTLDWSSQFRIVYRPPNKTQCKGLPHADKIWHGRAASRPFSVEGRVD